MAPFSMYAPCLHFSSVTNTRIILGDVIPAENIFTKARNLMPGRRRWKGKTTMALRSSGFISSGENMHLFCSFSSIHNIFSTLCSAEITFKTDPRNTDYAAEHGASRNFEPWREEKIVEEEDRLAKLEEEENNPMKVLENRTIDSKREMDILDALQDIRARNARNERVGQTIDLMARISKDEIESEEEVERRKLEEEDEKRIREVFSQVSVPSTTDTTGCMTIKRKADEEEPPLHSLLPESTRALINTKIRVVQPAKKPRVGAKMALGIKVKKK